MASQPGDQESLSLKRDRPDGVGDKGPSSKKTRSPLVTGTFLITLFRALDSVEGALSVTSLQVLEKTTGRVIPSLPHDLRAKPDHICIGFDVVSRLATVGSSIRTCRIVQGTLSDVARIREWKGRPLNIQAIYHGNKPAQKRGEKDGITIRTCPMEVAMFSEWQHTAAPQSKPRKQIRTALNNFFKLFSSVLSTALATSQADIQKETVLVLVCDMGFERSLVMLAIAYYLCHGFIAVAELRPRLQRRWTYETQMALHESLRWDEKKNSLNKDIDRIFALEESKHNTLFNGARQLIRVLWQEPWSLVEDQVVDGDRSLLITSATISYTAASLMRCAFCAQPPPVASVFDTLLLQVEGSPFALVYCGHECANLHELQQDDDSV